MFVSTFVFMSVPLSGSVSVSRLGPSAYTSAYAIVPVSVSVSASVILCVFSAFLPPSAFVSVSVLRLWLF
jgi:hypothetical protein